MEKENLKSQNLSNLRIERDELARKIQKEEGEIVKCLITDFSNNILNGRVI